MLRGPRAHATTNVNAEGLTTDKTENTTHGAASAAAPSTAARNASLLPSAALVGYVGLGPHGWGGASWGSTGGPRKLNPHVGQRMA